MRTEFCLILTLAATFAFAQEKTLTFPTNEQMRHFKAMSDPKLSPDGRHVLVEITDATADGAKSHIWMIEVDGTPARQLTYTPEGIKSGERLAEWMPDGQSILFTAKRGEHVTLFRLPMQGGEAKAFELKAAPVVDESTRPGALPPAKPEGTAKGDGDKAEPLALDVANYRVSPDGRTIALLASDPETPGEKKQKEAKADAEWVDHDLHGTRLYLLDVATGKLTVTGAAIDVRSAAWSADSSKLVVIREEPNTSSELLPTNSAAVVTLGDPAHPAVLEGIPVSIGTASWTTDGTGLYYLAQTKKDAPPGYPDLYEYKLATKLSRNLSDGFAGSMGRMDPLALKAGGMLMTVEQGVESGLMRYDAAGTTQPVKLPLAVLHAVATNEAQNGWIFAGDSGGKPMELLYASALTETPRVLATPALAPEGLKTAAPRRIFWKSDKLTIDGLLYLPPEAATRKVPLIVEVHGGPTGSYTDSYSIFTDFLLGQGWAVLRTNPRGSTGRGAEFAAANKNDLGGGDYRDIMAGVDYVLKIEPTIAADKLGLMGYSYGGEMAGFVEGKTTRFKGIVSAAPVIDQFSEYGTERGASYDYWFYGKPWEHFADTWRQSPLSGIAKAKTPFLLIQGESDTTDPLGQSQEMYRALRQMKVPVELVTYPRVDHGPLAYAIYGLPTAEPWHGFDARQRVVAFFEKAFR